MGMSTPTPRGGPRNTCRYPLPCIAPAEARGLCHSHYVRMANAGKINTTMVGAEFAAVLIRGHLARGRTIHNIAAEAGIDASAVRAIASGRTVTVRRGTMAAITAVPLPPTLIGTRRRLQALMWLGWSPNRIAREAGLMPEALRSAIHRDRYTPAARFAVTTVFETLSGTPGSSRVTAALAARRGAVPPLAWEGLDIDDPVTVADFGPAVALTTADRASEVEHLMSCGITKADACRQAGVNSDTLDQHRRRGAQRVTGTAA
ncbi:MAG: hypothetical protein ACRDQX_16300 [Pseudonocardiaceae bacterium]